MLDSICHMTLKLLKIAFCFKISKFLFRNVRMDVITLRYKICKPLVVYQFYCMVLYHSQTLRHVINKLTPLKEQITTQGEKMNTKALNTEGDF